MPARGLFTATLFAVTLTNSLSEAEAGGRVAPQQRRLAQAAGACSATLSVESLLVLADFAGLEKEDRLWDVVRSGAPSPVRAQCLLELAARHDSAMPEFLGDLLAQQLHAGPQADPVWRDALLYAAEQTQFGEPELRARAQALLLDHARLLRSQPAGPHAMWAALRRYATMISADQVGDFLEFLQDDDAPLTRQVALQCIEIVFSVEPPSDKLDLSSVRERVHALALHHFAPARIDVTEDAGLALSAFSAAVALGDPLVHELEAALLAPHRPHLLWLSEEPLQRLAQAWERTIGAGGDTGALTRLRAVRDRLKTALVEVSPAALRGA